MNLLIGTVNFYTKIFTEIWLETLFDSLDTYDPQNFNIKVVIVNNSPEENLDYLKKKYSDKDIEVVWIDNKENVGVAAAWNQIIKEGFDNNGNPLFDYYVPANNDIYFTKDWYANFVECLKQDTKKEYGWISSLINDFKEPNLTGITETVQIENMYWGGLRPEADDVISVEQMKNIVKALYAPFGGIDKFGIHLQKKYGLKLKESHPKAPLFALSKECIKKVGLFDEYNSPVGLHEDASMCHRVTRGGFKIGRANGTYAHHFSMMSRTRGEFKKEDWVNSREKAFTEKWGVSSKEMDKISVDKKFKLDIGSGPNPKQGAEWMHMDSDLRWRNVEYLQDVAKPFPFEDEEFEEIYASNVLEHVSHKEVPSVLYEWCRILKSGGKIHIRVPNFRFAAEKYLSGQWVASFIEGTELNIMHLVMGGDYEGIQHIHKALFDSNNLRGLLSDCGIINIQDVSNEGSWELRMEGIKQ